MTHHNILNLAGDKLKRLGQRHEDTVKPRLLAAKDQRELFSCRFPSTALRIFGDELLPVDEAIEIARLLTDLAQTNFACLENRVKRYHPKRRYGLLDVDDIWHILQYDVVTASLIDDEDYSRVAYFVRKYTGPACLAALATDGLLDEFFSAWS
ncbi:hypothetical protein [Agrobacterium tumefaciens]|uniref:hypothetical protein n=1 Tax=Agrobacterium tumefaciens TaxID=358 RepID=UPI001F1B2C42|nr:hypothetical protein [Agrobacterium tumefaciens]